MLSAKSARALSDLRKKRGVYKRSISRLAGDVKTLESTPDDPGVVDHGLQLTTRLETFDKNFRDTHFDIIELLDEDSEDFEKEDEKLGTHESIVTTLTLRLQKITKKTSMSSSSDAEKVASRKLSCVECCLQEADEVLTSLKGNRDEVPLLEQYQEQMSDAKKELLAIYEELISLGLPEEHPLIVQHVKLEKLHFSSSHQIKKLLSNHAHPPKVSAPSEDRASKLPKLDVPTFDGEVLHWQRFWEQFETSVHSRTSLTKAEKLVYLQQAIKAGSARTTIDGLSRSGDQYQEAIDCLKTRYNRPRIIHRAHVRSIMDTPSLKDGSGKELRRLHDSLQQHLRALRTMKSEPDPSFVTSIVELKLDPTTLFEWQKHSQATVDKVPHYQELLEFLDLRAQASETLSASTKKPTAPGGKKPGHHGKVAAFAVNADSLPRNQCVVCVSEQHPLYACPKFKGMSHDNRLSVLKKNNLCLNCLGSGHFLKQCKSLHRCKKCQKPHHTMLHTDGRSDTAPGSSESSPPVETPTAQIVSNAAVKLKSSLLLMTCCVRVYTVDGVSVEARALIDNGSTSSFVSERLVQSFRLQRSCQSINVSGIAGSSPVPSVRSIASFQIGPAYSNAKKIDLTAIVLPKVTCDLPVSPVPFDLTWTHLSDIPLADPAFGEPRRVDLLLGVDIFIDILRHGRRTGPPGSPVAMETTFGWVLCGGSTDKAASSTDVTGFHTSVACNDEVLRRFWEIEESPVNSPALSTEERDVVDHFAVNHYRIKAGRFVVPLPKKPGAKLIGESRSQAVRRFLALESSLHRRDRFQEVAAVMQEYLDLGHAEAVPPEDLSKDPAEVFYLPMHVVYKNTSSTTKVRAVFDASAKSSSGVSLNDTLLVGPTVHPPLIDVLLRFRMHQVALTTDVSKMYRAIELILSDRDLHRFVWRSEPGESLSDYRMTRATFGVSASCFAANMAVRQNSMDLAHKYPLAADAVSKSFYVDDGLTGADTVEDAIKLQRQLQDLFTSGGFLLRKWNSSEPAVLHAIMPDLRESKEVHTFSDTTSYSTKTLGLEWNATTDAFRVTTSKMSLSDHVTKRSLCSDIARIFDVLGWISPTTICMKILLQRVWEARVGWDDPVPEEIQKSWNRWRSELDSLMDRDIPRCYFPKQCTIVSFQLHGFSDASENAYAGAVYFRMVDAAGNIFTSLIMSKTKVSPIKRLSIPRLELCGALIVTRLLDHVKSVFEIPMSSVFAWTDSTIVLSWLAGSPRRFKTYVGNRVSEIVDRIPPDRWSHVRSEDNPADCASRGLPPSELLRYSLWWEGPRWLSLDSTCWPKKSDVETEDCAEEELQEVCLATMIDLQPVIPFDRFSSYVKLQRVTAWVLRFIKRCRLSRDSRCELSSTPCLTTAELSEAEVYLLKLSQKDHFSTEIALLQAERPIPADSSLLPLRPFIDSEGVLRVGGREQRSQLAYSRMHPIILHGNHQLVRFLIRSEHLRLLHAGPTLMFSSLSRKFHILRGKKTIRSVARQCLTCRRHSARPCPQLLGQLPPERITPGTVFETVGVDYAGPLQIKFGMVRRPTILKAYICVFVSLTVKAVHLEAVTNLTSEAFIAALRRFVARRGTPSLIWSDNGTNFVGANHQLAEMFHFLSQHQTKRDITDTCSRLGIEWRFIPEHSPHFGGLWEAAVKSAKTHLRRVVGEVRLTYEELSTILAQIEACLNSRPLVPMTTPDDDGIEALTPGHFIIGRPLCALPDPQSSYQSVSLLKRWDLCQNLIRHFWQRWSAEYLTQLNKFTKWRNPTRNLQVGDLVVLREDNLVPTKWPLARVSQVHCGEDGHVRVATVDTAHGSYKRPVTKLAPLLPNTEP